MAGDCEPSGRLGCRGYEIDKEDWMSRRTGIRVGAATLAATVAAAALAVSAGATKTVNVASTMSISAYGYFGKVNSSNPACVADRKVALKQQGHGVLGRDTTDEEGRWKIDPEDLHFKGQLPFKIYAELKPSSQGTAGTVYKCGSVTSKTITINGG
jgi:hypothetical protein